MSTPELGPLLPEIIRQHKFMRYRVLELTSMGFIQSCCPSFNDRIPNYRSLTPRDDQELSARQLNRVTDICMPDVAIGTGWSDPSLGRTEADTTGNDSSLMNVS